MSKPKRPLAQLLVERGLYPTRAAAMRAVIAGEVRSGTTKLAHPGELMEEDIELTAAFKKRFVSRGGAKLQGGLDAFDVAVKGARCLDVGCSTGGFTDCLLQAGAAHVVAVDVGYGQMAWSLRTNERVTLMERTNFSVTTADELGAPFDLIVADLSFRGLSGLMRRFGELLDSQGEVLVLVKPQFELPESLNKNGVVYDALAHEQALAEVIDSLKGSQLALAGLTYSPIKGPRGNIEFLLWARKGGEDATISIAGVVRAAHAQLD
jgi:23S rRNA (cytidine1920-2'-O)/16S rRNA (cytidine1409-2'-O)-methyltransferase